MDPGVKSRECPHFTPIHLTKLHFRVSIYNIIIGYCSSHAADLHSLIANNESGSVSCTIIIYVNPMVEGVDGTVVGNLQWAPASESW